ncbi:MAG: hypothetical protein FJW27_03905 [Acidimicrobiia bacterium]|nr:hypothetical protein [Acidimicrobiia bacterium]
MDPMFRWLETSAFSTWTRESTSVFAYPTFLSAHAIGMGLAVGVCVAVAFHRLGWLPGVPGHELRRWSFVLWFGVLLNAASGVLLLIAYPTKALTNPVFYLKLACIAVGLWLYRAMDRRLEPTTVLDARAGVEGAWPDRSALRRVAVGSLVSWAAAITAGRLLAYTYRRLFVDF